jgi:hypothetical protein
MTMGGKKVMTRGRRSNMKDGQKKVHMVGPNRGLKFRGCANYPLRQKVFESICLTYYACFEQGKKDTFIVCKWIVHSGTWLFYCEWFISLSAPLRENLMPCGLSNCTILHQDQTFKQITSLFERLKMESMTYRFQSVCNRRIDGMTIGRWRSVWFDWQQSFYRELHKLRTYEKDICVCR